MCIHYKITKKQLEESLKDQPQLFHLYKVVWKSDDGKYYPPHCNRTISFGKNNKIEGKRKPERVAYQKTHRRTCKIT